MKRFHKPVYIWNKSSIDTVLYLPGIMAVMLSVQMQLFYDIIVPEKTEKKYGKINRNHSQRPQGARHQNR